MFNITFTNKVRCLQFQKTKFYDCYHRSQYILKGITFDMTVIIQGIYDTKFYDCYHPR